MAPVFVKRYGKIKGSTVLYGFKIDQSHNDGIIRIDYLEDNKDYTPINLDKAAGVFDYGDWKDAFFMQIRPCMLKYDGTVDYYLNPNDYTKKINGSDSDNSNLSYNGNTMVEFPKTYYKIVDNGDDTANVYISNREIDSEFKCWSHLDRFGNEIDYCYISAYYAREIDNKLRSIKGQKVYCNTSLSNSVYYAENNGTGSNNKDYSIMLYCDFLMLQLCALLISKTVNSQEAFGYGYTYVTKKNIMYDLVTGYLDNKGVFYGMGLDKSKSQEGRMKFFGLEDYLSGYLSGYALGIYWNAVKSNNKYYSDWVFKMTYGTSDGSKEGYLSETNYVSSGILTESTDRSGSSYTDRIATKMNFTKYGFIPKEFKTFSSNYNSKGPEFETGYCDYFKLPIYGYGMPLLFSYSLENSTEYFRKYSGLFCAIGSSHSYTSSLDETNGQRLTCKPSKI